MTTGEKFEIIDQVLQSDDNQLSVSMLCEIAEVSRSGYYNWKANAPKREAAMERDRADFELILCAYEKRGYAKGARSIHMTMLHWDEPVVMNVKKIRRLMKKFGLFCPIRKANPHRRMARAIKADRTAGNVLNREFLDHGPRKVLLTDITYLPYGSGHTAYLSTLLDAYTREVLAYKVRESLELDFVLETVEDAVAHHGIELCAETLIHSDQGCHYTSVRFGQLLKDKNLRQSMSRKGCCWDNAPQESFYGHMKDEISLMDCTTHGDVAAVIDDWMDYYNNERYQWHLAKLSPREYYTFVTTGEYPLKGVLEGAQGSGCKAVQDSGPNDRSGTSDADGATAAAPVTEHESSRQKSTGRKQRAGAADERTDAASGTGRRGRQSTRKGTGSVAE